MVVLRCTNGWDWKTKRDCTYEVTYSDSALTSLVNTAKRNGKHTPGNVSGYHCPICGRFPLKMLKSKEPASI